MKNIFANGMIQRTIIRRKKCCSRHNPSAYPIYDSYVDKVLWYFRKKHEFASFKRCELKKHKKFIEILNEFKIYYGLGQCSRKELDKYLWQLGKKYFPNNYDKGNTNLKIR